MNLKFNSFTIGDNNYIENYDENNIVSNVLVTDDGYDEFYKVSKYLQETNNLRLISSEGITDMTSCFEYNDSKLTLKYLSLIDGMLILEYKPENSQQLSEYRLLVHNITKEVLEPHKIEKER